MEYFKKYTSNTTAGSSNQRHFYMEEGEIRTGRVLYKILKDGEFNYSLLFSNIIDSTHADGSFSHRNLICNSWKIHSARIGKGIKTDSESESVPGADVMVTDFSDVHHTCFAGRVIADRKYLAFDFRDITFGGNTEKNVMPGEFFATDPIKMNFKKGEYLCLELTFSGKMLPYHKETMLPVFAKKGDNWVYSSEMPLPGMVGCDRPVKLRLGFLGDSITQGIGTDVDSYDHWIAGLADKLGAEFAYWNLGIGCARANDAAADGAWLYKARQNDVVFVCLGVNDIARTFTAEQTKNDIKYVVETLKAEGKKIVLQTAPPHDWEGERLEKWNDVNKYICEMLKPLADAFYDDVEVLGESREKPQNAKFGGHPNPEGCALWAEGLYETVKELF